jgi:hypothetical protein
MMKKDVAQMFGGEHLRFTTQRGLDQQLDRLGNRVRNQYMLSFQPKNPHPGL